MNNSPVRTEGLTQEDFTKLVKGIFETLQSGNFTFPTENRHNVQPSVQPSVLSLELILQNSPQLNGRNWEKWARYTIRTLKGFKLLYLFKGIEEKEFVDAMDIVKTKEERAIDEAQAFAILRAGMDAETRRETKGIKTVAKCWLSLKEKFEISLISRHLNIMDDIMEQMKWQEGDKARIKWINIRHKLAEVPEYESFYEDQPITNFLARVIVMLWTQQLPSRIADIFERRVRQATGTWNDVMERIDDDILLLPTRQKEPKQVDASKLKRQARNTGKPRCLFCQKLGHKEEVCRLKERWEQRNISANRST